MYVAVTIWISPGVWLEAGRAYALPGASATTLQAYSAFTHQMNGMFLSAE